MSRAPSLSALFFGLLMLVFGLVAASALLQPPRNTMATGDLWDGSRSLQWEQQYTQHWPLREPLIGLWGGLRYHLFRHGSKGVVIGRDGWLFSAEEFRVPDDSSRLITARKQELRRITQQLQARQIQPLILWIPEKARLQADQLGEIPHPPTHRHLTPPEGVTVLNAEDVLAPLGDAASLRTDSHWSPQGAKAVAEAVAHKVQQQFPELTLQTTTGFQSHALETKPYTGDLARFVPTGPFPAIEAEPLTRYRSEQLGDHPSLFGEQTFDIILIGTSYSAQPQWHFAGFLKQALQSDILNLSDEAEGPFPPMRRLLTSLDSGEIKAPKLVIWEFPERYLIYTPDRAEGTN